MGKTLYKSHSKKSLSKKALKMKKIILYQSQRDLVLSELKKSSQLFSPCTSYSIFTLSYLKFEILPQTLEKLQNRPLHCKTFLLQIEFLKSFVIILPPQVISHLQR